MTWIIILVLLGILLIFIEVFFVPGTTVVGVLGAVFAGIAIIMAYQEKSAYGSIMLAVTLFIFAITIIIGAKSGVWQKLSNKSVIASKVKHIDENQLHVGDKGQSIAAIKPIGKARFNGKNFEVKSLGEYISPGQEVEIIKIVNNTITVKKIESLQTSGTTEKEKA